MHELYIFWLSADSCTILLTLTELYYSLNSNQAFLYSWLSIDHFCNLFLHRIHIFRWICISWLCDCITDIDNNKQSDSFSKSLLHHEAFLAEWIFSEWKCLSIRKSSYLWSECLLWHCFIYFSCCVQHAVFSSLCEFWNFTYWFLSLSFSD